MEFNELLQKLPEDDRMQVLASAMLRFCYVEDERQNFCITKRLDSVLDEAKVDTVLAKFKRDFLQRLTHQVSMEMRGGGDYGREYRASMICISPKFQEAIRKEVIRLKKAYNATLQKT